ncbi:RDD family protein [Micromonospora sp. CPCC 206060]|uniref:RDD family protein n=1 Tax=Micromonospora sp. CPCC 206060 TaxID=3122406 RepID=UPI002FF0D2AC
MTQPPPHPTPPVGGPPPAPGGFPPPGPPPVGYAPTPGHPHPGPAAGPGYGYPVPPYPGLRPPPPPPTAPGNRPLASFGDRLLAHLIDAGIWSVVAAVLFVPAFGLLYYNFLSDMYPDGLAQPNAVAPDPATVFSDFVVPLLLLEAGLIAVMLLLYYVYYVEIMFRSGQTVGKRAMKIRVVPLDPAVPLTRGLAFRRYTVQFLAGMVVPGMNLLDGLWQLWDKPYQQCLHDKFARTVVVKVPG